MVQIKSSHPIDSYLELSLPKMNDHVNNQKEVVSTQPSCKKCVAPM